MRKRCVVFVPYASFALIESFMPIAAELERLGHPCWTLFLTSAGLKRMDLHPLYPEFYQASTRIKTVSSDGTLAGKLRALAGLLWFLFKLRLRYGRIIFVHREKTTLRNDRIVNRLFSLFGRSYSLRQNQAFFTGRILRRWTPENQRKLLSLWQQAIPEFKPGDTAPTKNDRQAELIYSETELISLKAAGLATGDERAIGVPRLMPGWQDVAGTTLRRHGETELARLGIQGRPYAILALAHMRGPWLKDAESVERMLDWVQTAMRKHAPDHVLVIKPKPHLLKNLQSLIDRLNGRSDVVFSTLPLCALVQQSSFGMVVESSAVFEFLTAGKPVLDISDSPESWREFERPWTGIPGLFEATDYNAVDAFVAQNAGSSAVRGSLEPLKTHLHHDPAALENFLRSA